MNRKTKETNIKIENSNELIINSNDEIFNHMIYTFFFYLDKLVEVNAEYDLRHHLWEDAGIVIGEYLKKIIENKKIVRFSSVIMPMDDALIINSVDISRCYTNVDLTIEEQEMGFELSLLNEFINGLSRSLNATIHIKKLNGENAHHLIECCFKSLGVNIKECIRESKKTISTKGIL